MNVVEKICRQLPPDWEVRIEIEPGCAQVVVVYPNGEEVTLEGSLQDQIDGIPEVIREGSYR